MAHTIDDTELVENARIFLGEFEKIERKRIDTNPDKDIRFLAVVQECLLMENSQFTTGTEEFILVE